MSRIGYRLPIYRARQSWPQLNWPKASQPPCEHSENTGAQLRAAIREIAAAREVNQISTRKVLLALIERKGRTVAGIVGSRYRAWQLARTGGEVARLLQPSGIIPQTIQRTALRPKATNCPRSMIPLLASYLRPKVAAGL